MTGYELSRVWFNFSFEKKEAKPIHTALYLWIAELANRLGWKKEFGLPSADTMEGLSIGNKNTYLTALRDLRDWGFIDIISEAKNQYQASVISLCHVKNDTALYTALYTALDTALIQHSTQHRYSTAHGIDTSIDTIDKPLNQETNKPLNNKEGVTPPSPPPQKKNKVVFIPPTKRQVLDYFTETKKNEWTTEKIIEQAKSFWLHYSENGWKRGKHSMKDYKKSIVMWAHKSETDFKKEFFKSDKRKNTLEQYDKFKQAVDNAAAGREPFENTTDDKQTGWVHVDKD